MNEYVFSDLFIGQREKFDFEVTGEYVDAFRNFTGDINPLHCDKKFALDHGYTDTVVYGMLTASLISTFGGVYLPGKNCLIHQVETKFLKPVYIGDVITVEGVIVALHESVSRVDIDITMRNQDNIKVLKGILKAGLIGE